MRKLSRGKSCNPHFALPGHVSDVSLNCSLLSNTAFADSRVVTHAGSWRSSSAWYVLCPDDMLQHDDKHISKLWSAMLEGMTQNSPCIVQM